MGKPLIIDCSQICYASAFTLNDLSHEEVSTGVIFGFLLQVFRLAKDFRTRDFVFCWDSRKRRREEMYPEYKADRRDKPSFDEETLHQVRLQMGCLRRDVLPAMGFENSFIKTGLEADDLIACALRKVPGSTVISSDSDLYQLLGLCEMYNPQTKKRTYVRDFTGKYGVSPEDWVDVLAIAGTHNNVEGIEGAGIGKAIQYLKGTLPDGKVRERIEAGKELIERNKSLIRLPLEEVDLDIRFPDEFDLDEWLRVFQRYEFRSFMNEKGMEALRRDFFEEV